MARLLPDAEVGYHDHLSESYKLAFQQLRRENAVSEPLYPGIAALIRELDADGWLLGVATGKSDRGLRLCLAHHGIHAHFVTLQTEIGRASCRERVCQYVYISVGAGSFKKKTQHQSRLWSLRP